MVDFSKLTPFEWSMIEGDRSSPMTFFIRLCFHGNFDSEAFRSAVRSAVRLHPLLSANVQAGKGGNEYRWVPVVDPQPYISIAESGQSLEYPGNERIDLRTEIGLRAWSRHGDDRAEVRFQFHHACCDGIGAFRLIEDFFLYYDGHGRDPKADTIIRKLDHNALAYRTPTFKKKMSTSWRLLRSTIVLPVRVLRLCCEQTDAIWAMPKQRMTQHRAIGLLDRPSHTFSEEVTNALRSKAHASGATFNDLLLRDLFCCINRWNARHGSVQCKRLRLLVPFSLRTEAHVNMPAANCVSMAYVTATQNRLEESEQLLSCITKQRNFIRRWQIEYSWNQTVSLTASSRLVTWLLRRRAKRRFATSVLSNMGRVFGQANLPQSNGKIRCGDLVLQSVEFAPPANPLAVAAFGCHEYAGSLTMTMNYHLPHFDETEAAQLMSDLTDQIHSSATIEQKK